MFARKTEGALIREEIISACVRNFVRSFDIIRH